MSTQSSYGAGVGNAENAPISGVHRGLTFRGRTVILDGGTFQSCRFERCDIVYSGGEPPVLQGCQFDSCQWGVAGAAANTLNMLAAFQQGGFSSLVEPTLEAIRSGTFFSAPPDPDGGATAAADVRPEPATINLGFGVFPVPRVVRRRRAEISNPQARADTLTPKR